MRAFLLLVVVALAATLVRASDWPAYMHDNQRSGVTDESPPANLSQHWVYRPPVTPRPAWPDPQAIYELPKLRFDDAFYAVVSNNVVYFGSSVDHQVHALDAATGIHRWRFFTDGPVRLAPTVVGGRLYVGSDDGKVYCVDAASGKSLWQFDAARDPRRVIGNGQITSLWPVRTDVMIDGDSAIFAAGIFPYHSPTVFKLTLDGRPIDWQGRKEKDWVLLSPQGYLLRTPRAIVIPGGRTYPTVIDPTSGNQLYKVISSDRIITGGGAGSYGLAHGSRFYFGTQNSIYGFDDTAGTLATQTLATRKIVIAGDVTFAINAAPLDRYKKALGDGFNGVTAYRVEPEAATTTRPTTAPGPILWRYPIDDAQAMIVAGDSLFVGARGRVVQLDRKSGKPRWESSTEGDAVGLAFSGGRLIVSTTQGMVYCFAGGDAPRSAGDVRPQPASPDPAVAAFAEQAPSILDAAGVRRGFALTLGAHATGRALVLAARSDAAITALEPDDDSTLRGRLTVDAANLYGHRVIVQAFSPTRIPYPDYAANLILLAAGVGEEQIASDELLRCLKPCGGVLMIEGEPSAQLRKAGESVGRWTHGLKIAGSQAEWSRLVRGELEGSGWWRQAFGDAGNTGSSSDKIIRGDLAVLWFGEPGAGESIDRHERGMSPLASHGRVFFQGWSSGSNKNSIVCFDLYNGLRYWEREIPGAVRLRLPAVSGNLACNDEFLFVVAGAVCHQIDAATGVTRRTFELPDAKPDEPAAWGYVGLSDGVLVGSRTLPMAERNLNYKMDARRGAIFGSDSTGTRFSDLVFAYDIATGNRLWVYRGKEVRDSTIAMSAGRLFFAENRGELTKLPARSPEGGMFYHLREEDRAAEKSGTDRLGRAVQIPEPEVVKRFLVSLDARTGKVNWEKEADLTGCGIWGASTSTREAAGYRELQMLTKADTLLIAASYDRHDAPHAQDVATRKAMAFSAVDGSVIWSTSIGNLNRPIIINNLLVSGSVMRDLSTGFPLEKADPRTGRTGPWTIQGGNACGTPSACDSTVFFRYGGTGWWSLETGARTQFMGIRPGCFTNILPVGGVVVQPEASSGCTCNYSVQCTLAFVPARPTANKQPAPPAR